jgi:hypothetical protein
MNFEKYQPSKEETEKAEDMMTDEEKKLSEAREGGYELDESKMQEAQTKEKGLDKSYQEKTTVNGVEISIHWDSRYDDYTIYFPQIEIGWAARERGVDDQVIRISRKREVAKQVFDEALKLAQTESDVYEVYKKVEAFSQPLPYEDEEE